MYCTVQKSEAVYLGSKCTLAQNKNDYLTLEHMQTKNNTITTSKNFFCYPKSDRYLSNWIAR